MSSRLRIGIIVAVVGIILITLGSIAVIRMYRQAINPPDEQVVEVETATGNVVVASHDITLGTYLTQDDLALVQMPVEFTTRDSISNLDDAVGKIIKVDVIDGEMILGHNLATPTDVTHDVAYVLSETHVLMAFPATDLISRESVIQRGDIVDIYATITTTLETVNAEGETTTESTSVTFDSLQRLEITAMIADIIVDDNATRAQAGEDEDVPRNDVNVQAYLLSLDPQNALILKYLIDTDAIFDFVLRAPTSTGQFNLTPVTSEYINELYGLEILP